MSVELASEIWTEIKRHINSVDRNDAAETMVSVLIDNDVSAEEIKSAFKGDAEIKRALSDYLKEEELELEEDLDEEEDLDDY
jgi:hypothetical protein